MKRAGASPRLAPPSLKTVEAKQLIA